jgi:membrane-associated phospholipid phosphatase
MQPGSTTPRPAPPRHEAARRREPTGGPHPARALGRLPAWAPVHRFIAFWLLLTTPLLAVPVSPVGPRLALLALHLAVASLLLWQPLDPAALPGPGRFWREVRDWLPLVVVPLFYWETPLLAEAIHRGAMYDQVVLGWEAALFGGQPSQTMGTRWPWRWLSEPLHAAYLSYYLIIMGPPVALYLIKRRGAFRRVVFTFAVALIVHQAAFISFPVLGPRYLFPAPTGPLEAGPLYQLTHRVLEGASSPGTAFPSSHVGISVAVTLAVFRERLWAAPLLAVLTTMLAVATVYGGFHYAVDALAGLALGVAVALAAPGLRRRLRRRRRPAPAPGT